MDLIIATGNRGKLKEYRDILAPLGWNVLSQAEAGADIDVEETGTTFEENAVLKARAVWERTGACVLSDDSGLQVAALNGEPGIYSARYRGLKTEEERRQAVLKGLEGAADRSARFVCCICFMTADGAPHLFTGVWNGSIAAKASGSNGFGYDPIFVAGESGGHTTAEMPIEFKETRSHRARAVRLLTEWLRAHQPETTERRSGRPAAAGQDAVQETGEHRP